MSNLLRYIAVNAIVAFMAFQAAQAQTVTVRDWVVGVQSGNEGPFAATINDSGLAFGEYCFVSTKECIWLVGGDVSCKENSHHTALATTEAGAFPIGIICGKELNGKFVYVFENWAELESALKRSSKLAIAVPVGSDGFVVWRFSLNGMLEATRTIEEVFSAVIQGPTGTASERL